MDESQNYYIDERRQAKKECIVYNFIYVIF